jgi:hypothetical protein
MTAMTSGERPPARPFPQSFWVEPGRLLAGQYPGDPNPSVRDAKLNALLDCGIRAVLSLIPEGETGVGGQAFVPYVPRLQALGNRRGLRVECRRIGTPDATVPTPAVLARILGAIRDAAEAGLPLYIHCWGGHGRTGTVVCSALIDQGLSADEAIRQLMAWRSDLPKSHYPFEGGQEAFVRRWAERPQAMVAAELRRLAETVTRMPRQEGNRISVVPLLAAPKGPPAYLHLDEALCSGLVAIHETSQSGSVPHVRAVSRAALPVLLLDGEELAGARQNRIVNTTVLLKAGRETVLPVSCTEVGRWAYTRPDFCASGHVLAHSVRTGHRSAVTRSVQTDGRFASDQSGVWNDIAALHRRLRSESPTGAMRDAFGSHETALTALLAAFPRVSHQQCGVAILIDGQMVSVERVSHPALWAGVHEKVLKSALIEALDRPYPESGVQKPSRRTVRTFLNALRGAAPTATVVKSIGHGYDCRFAAGRANVSALVHDGAVVHLSALA